MSDQVGRCGADNYEALPCVSRMRYDERMSIDATDDKYRRARELLRLDESAAYIGQSQFQQAKFWRGINLVVGIPAAMLAAVSGAAGLSSVANRVIAAYLAFAAAGLGRC